MVTGANALSKNANGRRIALLIKDPLVIAHKTGSSRSERKPDAFSAFTAKSSPNMPAVFLAATLVMTAMSSIRAAMSSSNTKNPDAIFFR